MIINSFPDSIIENIFSFLKVKHIVTANKVCKKWNRIINSSLCWINVDFSEVSIHFNQENLKRIQSLLGPLTEILRFDDNTSNEVNNIIKICPRVEEMHLFNVRLYSEIDILLWPRCLTVLEIIDTYINDGKFYEQYQLNGVPFPQLRSLVVMNPYVMSENDLKALLSSKTVETLKIKYCSTFVINSIIEFCPNLISIILQWGSIEIDDNKLIMYLWPKSLKVIKLNSFPNTTAIARTNNSKSGNIEAIFSKLRVLHLKNCIGFSSRSLNTMIKHGNITHINLDNLTAANINQIVEHSKCLMSISLKLIFKPQEKEKLDLLLWPSTLKVINLKHIDIESFNSPEPFYRKMKKEKVKKIFPLLQELHCVSCSGFTYRDLVAIGPSECLYSLTPMASMINDQINLLEMFPQLIRINLRCLPNISCLNLLKWLDQSHVTQFEILDQEFADFTLADLLIKLISSRLDDTKRMLLPVSWVRLSLVHNLLPSHLLPELSELLTDETPPLTLIIDIFDEESNSAWNIERNCVLKKNTSLGIIID